MKTKNFFLSAIVIFLFIELIYLISFFSEDLYYFWKRISNQPNQVEVVAVVGEGGNTGDLKPGDFITQIENDGIKSANQVDREIERNRGSEIKVTFNRNGVVLDTHLTIPENYSDQNFGLLYRDTLRNQSIAAAVLPPSMKAIMWFSIFNTVVRIIWGITSVVAVLKNKKWGIYLAYGYLALMITGIIWHGVAR